MATPMTHTYTHIHIHMHAHTHTHIRINKETDAYTRGWRVSCAFGFHSFFLTPSLCLSSFAFAIVFASIFPCLLLLLVLMLQLLLLARNDFANWQLLFMCRTLLNEFKRGKLPANQAGTPRTPRSTCPQQHLATHTHTLNVSGTLPAAIEPSNCVALLSTPAKPIKGPSDGIFLLRYKLKISYIFASVFYRSPPTPTTLSPSTLPYTCTCTNKFYIFALLLDDCLTAH